MDAIGIERRTFLWSLGASFGLAGGCRSAVGVADIESWASSSAPTRTALLDLLDVVRAMDARFVDLAHGVDEAWERAEAHRYFVHLLAASHQFIMENDPERPRFVRLETPWRKLMGGNPDAYYFFAPLRGDRAYRIRGGYRGEVYRSLTVHGGKSEGWPEYVISHINDRQWQSESDGSYGLVLGPERQPGNWIELTPDTRGIITRHYFLEKDYAPAARGWAIPIEIEPLVDPGPRPEPSEESVVRKLNAMTEFFRMNTEVLFGPEERLPSFVGRGYNRFGEPSFWGGKEDGGGWGAIDNSYTQATYKLAPDEALVITGRYPPCAFSSIVLTNRWLQSYDFNQRRISINMRQTALEPDGSFRIILAHEDPRVPNWIDTGTRPEGRLAMRFQLPEKQPQRPDAEVVKLASLH